MQDPGENPWEQGQGWSEGFQGKIARDRLKDSRGKSLGKWLGMEFRILRKIPGKMDSDGLKDSRDGVQDPGENPKEIARDGLKYSQENQPGNECSIPEKWQSWNFTGAAFVPPAPVGIVPVPRGF